MGSWTVVIHGHGPHDNGSDFDVERTLVRFLADLQDQGHSIERSDVTIGTGRQILVETTATHPATERRW
jgi:hypothetical protein